MGLLTTKKRKRSQEAVPQTDTISERGASELSPEFLRNFLTSIQAMATSCINDFFRKEQLYCGGDIEEDRLHSQVYVSLVMNTDIGSGVDIAYLSFDRSDDPPKEEAQEQFVTRILRRCAKLGIPKCFAGGILLMYMELCKGISLCDREYQAAQRSLMDDELEFISGRIFDLDDIPKSKRYLYKYFRPDTQRQFVKYYLTYGYHTYFVARTGVRFGKRYRKYLAKKLRFLEATREKALADFDLETLTLLETGKFKVSLR